VKIILATHNPGKIREFNNLVEYLDVIAPVNLVPLSKISEAPQINEDGHTFEDNAVIKARTIARATGEWCLADDSGLCVSALHGRPGINSARYAGTNATDEQNNAKLMDELKDVPKQKRQACYRCALAFSDPTGKTILTVGECIGLITKKPAGEFGFGYDPYFYVPHLKQTMAEVGMDIKNKMSHRALAIKELASMLSTDPRFHCRIDKK
jgi:non-canonical purine NTP pyrophosphatase (RdgB/HAM1 family)